MASVSQDRRFGISTSVAIKAPCICATTANITLSGEQTIDGVTTSEDRVLVKNQTDATENGIYLSDTGAWTREPDFDGNRDVVAGTIVTVNGGSVNENTLWRVDSDDHVVIDTSDITFVPNTGSATDSSSISFTQAGTGAVVTTARAKLRQLVTPQDFGAVGDGSTNDLAAFQLLIAAYKHFRIPAGTYNLGTLSSSSSVLAISGAGGKITIETEGFVKFTFARSGVVTPKIFDLTDCDGLHIGDLHFTDTGYSAGSPNSGATGVTLTADASHTVKNVDIGALYMNGGLAPLIVIGTASTLRITGVHVGLISAINTTYGYNAQNNGDGVTIDQLYTNACNGRSFFVYGCKSVRANIYSVDNASAGTGDVLISAYSNGLDTVDVKINYTCKGTSLAFVPLGMQFNSDELTARKIVDCNINADIDMGAIALTDVVYFSAYNLAGTVQNTSTTINTFERITLNGRILATNTTNKINIGCQPTTIGNLFLGSGISPIDLVTAAVRTYFKLGETGTWTPVLTFGTPGNLSVAYAASGQVGRYTLRDNLITYYFQIVTSTFTHTTASGNLIITGLLVAAGASIDCVGANLVWQGITKANFTQVAPEIAASDTAIFFNASGSAQNNSAVAFGDCPTGGTVRLVGSITCRITSN